MSSLHTIAVYYDGTTYTPYNKSLEAGEVFNPEDYKEQCICGYYLKAG